MTITVTDEAVEAMAERLYRRDFSGGPDGWTAAHSEGFKSRYRAEARAFLDLSASLLQPQADSGLRKALEALAEEWRYKSEDLTPWQEGGGPSPDEAAFDDAAEAIRKLLAAHPALSTSGDVK